MTAAETGIMLWVHAWSTPALDCFFTSVTHLGRAKLLVVLFLGQALFFLLRRQRGPLRATVSVGLGVVVIYQLKDLFERARPEYWSWLAFAPGHSFPSGHSTGAAAYWGLLAWLCARSWPFGRRWFWGLGLAIIALVGLSRVYIGVHWPTDVLAGWTLGGLLVWNASRGPRCCPGAWQTSVPGLDEPSEQGGSF